MQLQGHEDMVFEHVLKPCCTILHHAAPLCTTMPCNVLLCAMLRGQANAFALVVVVVVFVVVDSL